MGPMDHPSRRERLVRRLSEVEAEAMLVTRIENVRYLSGFTGSNAQLLVASNQGVLLTDSRYEEQARHEVPDMERVIYPRSFAGAFAEACRAASIRRVAFESAGVTYRTHRELSGQEGIELVPSDDLVERLRWAKDREELRLLETAQELTDEAFDRVVPKLAEGVTERRVGFELELAMREAGADALAFDPIVAFGENAAEPHHGPTDRPLRPGDVVKMDFGCVVDGYHSDMTRTVAFGDPGPELREIYQVVQRAQAAGREAVRAGVRGSEPDRAARDVISEAGFGERFGHSLGHGVGLEIHEGPSLRAGSEEELPAGTVVTVEPGIYVAGLGGVRIEDLVEVSAEGCRPLPRTTRDLVLLEAS
jgi:Xaa-Pro aminopeptidase